MFQQGKILYGVQRFRIDSRKSMVGASISVPKEKGENAIFSPILDALVLGGISILCFAVLQAMEMLTPFMHADSKVMTAVFILGLLVNQPHYSATYYRVYRNSAEAKRYPIVAFWVPLVLGLIGIACFFSPSGIAPWFCKAYFLTVAYHYSGQSYGIALIFAHKAGIAVTRLLKLCVGLPIYASGLLFLIGDEVIANHREFYDVKMPMIGFAMWHYLIAIFIVVLGMFAYIGINLKLGAERKRLPMIVHIIVLSQLIWFSFGLRLEVFILFVPLFHCLQYLLVTTYFRFQELVRNGELIPASSLSFLKSFYFWRYYGSLVVLGLVMFNLIPTTVGWTKVCTADFAFAIIYSFINLHHFLLDGEIWKLRKPEVGKALIEKVA